MSLSMRPLPGTQLLVSDLCLGTMTWGRATSKADAHNQLAIAVAHGINFIDTAEVYPVPATPGDAGETERILGDWLSGQAREGVVIGTKVTGRGRPDLVRAGRFNLSRDNIVRAAEDSLARLRTDYIDLYQIHAPARNAPRWGGRGFTPEDDGETVAIEEQVDAMRLLLAAGKIRHWGICNETPWGAMQFRRVSAQMGVPAPVTIQNGYNLIERSFEYGLSEVCARETMGLLAYSPLAGGVLTGKYVAAQRPAGSRFEVNRGYADRWIAPRALRLGNAYAALARSRGCTPEHMALAFVRQQWFLTSAIIGATSNSMLASNLRCLDLVLDDETLTLIEQISNE